MIDFQKIVSIIATATELPAFIIENDCLYVVRTGYLNRALLISFNKLIMQKHLSSNQNRNQKIPNHYKLLKYVDDNYLTTLVIVSNINNLCYIAIFGPFYIEEKSPKKFISYLCQLKDNNFTEETARIAVEQIAVKDNQFVNAWGQLADSLLSKSILPFVKINTIMQSAPYTEKMLSLTDSRIDETAVRISYAFEREIILLVSQGDKARLKQLLVPKNSDEVDQSKYGVVLNSEGSSWKKLRRVKNLLVSTNTLFRLAAENAGLPSVNIHTISEKVITEIEQSSDSVELISVIDHMIDYYCNSIRNVSLLNHSMKIVRVQKYIISHLNKKISLNELTEIVDLDSSYLCRLFKKECHMTINEYIRSRRIGEAKWMLECTETPIMQISNDLGYQDQSYFSILFKKATGLTPSEYRKNQGNLYKRN